MHQPRALGERRPRCPRCGNTSSTVNDIKRQGETLVRFRKCDRCAKSFQTIEDVS